MEAKALLLSLYFEFNGDSEKMYEVIAQNKDATDIIDKWENKVAREIDNYAWYYDEEYPYDLKVLSHPPLIVKKSNIKEYKFRFVSYTDITVSGDSYDTALRYAATQFLESGPDFETTKIIHKRK